MIVYTDTITVTPSASTSAVGYPASNLALQSVGRPWRSTTTGATTITLDMGSNQTPAALLLQDANFTAATIATSPDNATWTTRGTLALAADGQGRYKGVLALGVACRYVRASVSGSPTDGAAYWRVGAAYLWLSAAIVTAPDYGMQIAYNYPQSRADLPNGAAVTVGLGPSYAILTGKISGGAADNVAAIMRAARSGVIGVDMQSAQAPWLQFPMVHREKSIDQTAQDWGYWPTAQLLREAA